jgi:hypothetical protein
MWTVVGCDDKEKHASRRMVRQRSDPKSVIAHMIGGYHLGLFSPGGVLVERKVQGAVRPPILLILND